MRKNKNISPRSWCKYYTISINNNIKMGNSITKEEEVKNQFISFGYNGNANMVKTFLDQGLVRDIDCRYGR